MLKVVRSVNVVLGVWLAASALLWTHSDAQLRNAWMVGIVTAVVAGLAVGLPQLRWISGVLALWLFVSAFALPHVTVGTVWNSVVVSVIMFSVSIAETMGPVGKSPAGPTW